MLYFRGVDFVQAVNKSDLHYCQNMCTYTVYATEISSQEQSVSIRGKREKWFFFLQTVSHFPEHLPTIYRDFLICNFFGKDGNLPGHLQKSSAVSLIPLILLVHTQVTHGNAIIVWNQTTLRGLINMPWTGLNHTICCVSWLYQNPPRLNGCRLEIPGVVQSLCTSFQKCYPWSRLILSLINDI